MKFIFKTFFFLNFIKMHEYQQNLHKLYISRWYNAGSFNENIFIISVYYGYVIEKQKEKKNWWSSFNNSI